MNSGALRRGAMLAVLAVSVSGAAAAVDLKNEDSKTYKVGVHERSFTTWTSVSGGTTLYGVCPECRIEVVGLGTVRASGADVVVIRDGALDIQ